MHSHEHTREHACKPACTHACMHRSTHARMHSMHAHKNACTDARGQHGVPNKARPKDPDEMLALGALEP